MPRKKREYWARLVAELERSGEQQQEFAAKRGVKLCTLQNWLYRIRRERRTGDDASRILPVRVVASTAPLARRPEEENGAVEVMLVRFASGTATDLIADVVTRLRRC
ncbi:MAG TPA: hypothetical protein VH392_04670 [Sphingomicrobium sp.]|jgi:hypothetical protein